MSTHERWRQRQMNRDLRSSADHLIDYLDRNERSYRIFAAVAWGSVALAGLLYWAIGGAA